MQYTLSKKHIGYVLGGIFALGIGMIALTSISNAHAALETGSLESGDLFGGDVTGSQFASQAGLGEADLVNTISQIIRIALGFLGVIAVVIILLGGFKWMTAAGNDDKVKDAKKLIFSGIIGLVIILSAYAIASFVIDAIVGATADSSSSSSSS